MLSKMFSKREWVIFAAGAQTFHTLSHIAVMYVGILPIYVFGIAWTQQVNYAAILINAGITLALFKWARSLRR